MYRFVSLFALISIIGCALAFSNDPIEDATLKTDELIAKYGYPVETHTVITNDGYLLEMHRIPHGINGNDGVQRPPVLVMHGMFCSSAIWVNMGPGSSLGYLLADAGYDVWLGNARGNRYSRSHIALNPETQSDYWNFSWHEIGINDLASMTAYVIANTGYPSIHLIAQSQGTTNTLVLLATRPEYNLLFKSVHLMAPIAYITDEDNFVANFSTLLQVYFAVTSPFEVFPSLTAVQATVERYCGISSQWAPLCNYFITHFAGYNNINATMLPVILGHVPAGASSKQLAHANQVVSSQEFKWYDYGVLGNLANYGALNAPTYNLRAIFNPVNLYYSLGDSSVAVSDVWRLWNQLPFAPMPYLISDPNFSHVDYVWGMNAQESVWDEIIARMNIADNN